MPQASEVATELRRIADVFDTDPCAEIVQPELSFYHGHKGTKEQFLAIAKIMPHPFKKSDGWNHEYIVLTHETKALRVRAQIERSKVCTLIAPARPAQYECKPILSAVEEAALGPF